MINFEQLEHITENMDDFGDNSGSGSLFKLQPGVIKIKINPLPHGTIYSSRIVMRLIPQVEGQNTRRFASWRFFD